MKKIMVLCLSGIFLLTACAGGPQSKTGQGAALGTLAGAAIGAIAGQTIEKDTEGTLTGTVVGAAAGAAIGAGVGAMMDKQQEELNEALANSEAAVVHREGDVLAINLKGDVTFDSGSSKVKTGLYSEIDRIAEIMVKYPETAIIVEGHTDSVGKEKSNIELSKRRAEAVKNLLVQRGVGNSRVRIVGYGESQPIDDNGTREGRQRNRRVEIKLEPTGTPSS